MSLYDKSSLIQVPSLYKDGTLVSTIPEDRSGDFTFTRGSNISATRVNADGNIEKGYENLLLQSNSFDTTWTSAGTTITDGQSGYDGSNNAWLLESTNTGQSSRIQSISQSGVQTASVYAKAGNTDWMFIYLVGSPDKSAWFNLSSGSLGTTTGIDSSIESVGNGWYRCSVSYSTTISSIRIYVSDGNGNVSSSLGANIYIQDAMLNQGMVAYPYVETTTAPVAGGILEDMPRLDYSNGSCPSLLLEPSRTNSNAYSEHTEASWWPKYNCTTLDNQGISPEGLNNAARLTTLSPINSVIYKAGQVCGSLSFFAKPDNISTGKIHISVDGVATARWNTDGTLYSVSGGTAVDGEDYGNGWFRFAVNVTSGSVVNYGIFGESGASMLIYGIQNEPNATYPTSYIPTYGVSQTRLSDVTDRSSNLAYTGNYTLFMEFELTKDRLYLLNSNTSTAYTFFIENDDCYFQFGRTGGDSGSVLFVNMFDWRAALGTTIKMAFYKSGTNAKLFVNGTPYTPSGNTLSTGNEVLDWRYLNYTTTPNRQQQAYIKQLVEFETALSDEACIELTTIS